MNRAAGSLTIMFSKLTAHPGGYEGRKEIVNIQDIMLMPRGMNIETYSRKLKALKRIEKRIASISNKRYETEDKLEVLSDEKGSERYNKNLDLYNKLIGDLESQVSTRDELLRELGRL